ncbi:MAG TPA: nucleotidyltransferase domain-containing protein [Spongiibacteraceae bacterium]
MKPSEALETYRADIRRVVAANHAANARIFGSVVRGTDNEGSDLDLLIDPLPRLTLFRIAHMQLELEHLLGVRVDIRTPNDLPEKIRRIVLHECVPV